MKTNTLRTIKFRGKRTDSGEWVYGHYFTTPLTAEYEILPENGAFFDSGLRYRRHAIADENGCAFEVAPETVGQHTGLYDSERKEIYEGDLVEYRNFMYNFDSNQKHIGVIEWRDKASLFCCTRLIVDGKPVKPEYDFRGVHFEWSKIIGNIHDNHSMLTQNKFELSAEQKLELIDAILLEWEQTGQESYICPAIRRMSGRTFAKATDLLPELLEIKPENVDAGSYRHFGWFGAPNLGGKVRTEALKNLRKIVVKNLRP